MRPEVIVLDGDLSRAVWRFWYADFRHFLVLNSVEFQSRATKRHKWKSDYAWCRIYERRSTIPMPDFIPDDVMAAARQQFLDSLKVGLPDKDGRI